MKKLLIIGGVLVVLAGIGVLIVFNMDWGERTSTIEKTDIVEVEDSTDTDGNILPGLDDLMGTYSVSTETGKAELLFEIDGLKETKGAFESFEVNFDIKDDFTASELEVSIQSATINTENEMRDDHLKEADYFNVETYPEIRFFASSIAFEDEKYTAAGDLEFIGASNPLTISFDHVGGQDLENGTHIEVFEGNFEFDRTEYGMEEESSIGNVVGISFYVELEQN